MKTDEDYFKEAGEIDCILSWRTEREVKSLLEKQWERVPKGEYPSQFNTRTHYMAFEKYLREKSYK